MASISHEIERQLIERARLREPEAMRELIELHKDRLFAFLWRMIRNHHDAEDVCQDAFLKAFASLDSFSVQYRFSTWLFTIGYRICLNRLRSKRAINSDPDVFASTPASDESSGVACVESKEAAELRKTV
ncbi:MAG: sigma-70 family RNA polymerase sigma factor, partial [Planctomycetes bacterium]|nr:sigma-70 family RNA polymerase sigma factor [Planctomycetota bacterium]